MTTRLRRQVVLASVILGLCRFAQAGTVTITINMANVLDQNGSKIATTSLFQLVSLGANGVFDPVPVGAWVGGDDKVISQLFSNSDGWPSAAAFDLENRTGAPGQCARQFTFILGNDLQPGMKLGIRWFPTVTAANFGTTTPAAGMPYGQFTRQSMPLYGGSLWVVPQAGSFRSFDPLVSISYDSVNGKDPNPAGAASLTIGLTPFQLWQQTYFGNATLNTGPSEDFDGDGVPNLVEYALGLNPTQASNSQLPQARLIGGNLVMNFSVPAGVSGVTYGAEWTTTLQPGDWHPSTDTGSGSQHNFSVPLGTNKKMFMRLKVSSP